METVIETDEFKNALNALNGKRLWDAVTSDSTGADVLFKFGRKFRAKDVYENPRLSEEDIVVGELSIMAGCPWRIEEGESRLLCGSGDLHTEGGPMLAGLEETIGDTVNDVSLNSFLDLLLIFSSGRRLRLFCAHKEDDMRLGHYDLCIICEHEQVLYGAVNGVITCERIPRGCERKNAEQ